jgi:drug/metabolite transporter (DMT)-like permease
MFAFSYRSVLWTLASAVSFVAANSLVKALSERLPPLELALCRAAGGLVLLLAAWRCWRQLRCLNDPWLHLVRAAVGSVSLVAIVHAYSFLPLALVTSVLYLRILLVIPLQRVFLRESAPLSAWIAAAVGIVGGIMALWPKLSAIATPAWSWAVVSLIVAPVAGAGSQVCMRRLARTNSPSTVVCTSAFLIAGAIAFPALQTAVLPPVTDIAILVLMAGLSGIAQWATVWSYRYAPPSQLMPLTLVDLPLATLVGMVAFSENPPLNTYVGSALIVSAAVFVATRIHDQSQR